MNRIAALAAMIPASAMTAYLAACFRKSYLQEQPFSLKKCLPEMLRYFLIAGVCFITAAVLGILFYEQKAITAYKMIQYIFLWQGLFLVAGTDIKVKKIPNKVLLVLALIRFAGMPAEIFLDHRDWQVVVFGSLFAAAVGAILILICMLVSRGGIGAGDMKLYALMGLYCGSEALINIMFYSIFSAAIVSIILLVSKKVKMKSTLPMAPFILFGFTVFVILRKK